MSSPSNQNARNLDTVAGGNAIGGIPVIHRIEVADATGNNDIVVDAKFRVTGAHMRASGAAAHATDDTWQLKNGTSAITEAVAKTATAKAVSRAATIDAANEEVAAGGTLRVAAVKSTNAAGTVYVQGILVP